jgi:hypothetical protein
LISFLVNAPRSGLQPELDAFFDHALGVKDARPVSKSALCQARQDLDPQALRTMLTYSATLLAEHTPAERWHGRRVLALDGTTLRVPNVPECAEHFGGMDTSCGKFRPLARASAVFDVLRGCFIDAALDTFATDERTLAQKHLDALGAGDLLVMDRGYPSRRWFTQLQERNIGFCSRITGDHRWKAVRRFTRGPSDDAIVDLGTRDQPMLLRLVRAMLPNGKLLVMATNLYDKGLQPSNFAELYRRRWRIEEAFKLIKARLQVENWTGVLPHTVEQDFFASLIRINSAATLAAEVSSSENSPSATPSQRHLNITLVIKTLRHYLPRLLLGLQRCAMISKLIERLSSPTAFERSSPNWSPRREKGVRIAGFHPAYKAA